MLHDVLRFVHVCEQAVHGDGSDGVTEEYFLYRGRVDGTEGGQHEQEFAKPRGLGRVGRSDVLAQRQLGLVLQSRYRGNI